MCLPPSCSSILSLPLPPSLPPSLSYAYIDTLLHISTCVRLCLPPSLLLHLSLSFSLSLSLSFLAMPWQERSWRPFTLSHFSILPLAPSPARFNPPTGLLSTHRAIPPQPACTSHEIQLVHLEQYHSPSTQFRATCAHSFSLPPLSSWAILIGNRWKIVRGRGRGGGGRSIARDDLWFPEMILVESLGFRCFSSSGMGRRGEEWVDHEWVNEKLWGFIDTQMRREIVAGSWWNCGLEFNFPGGNWIVIRNMILYNYSLYMKFLYRYMYISNLKFSKNITLLVKSYVVSNVLFFLNILNYE